VPLDESSIPLKKKKMKIAFIILTELPVLPVDPFEATAFKPCWTTSNPKPSCRISSVHFLLNVYHRWLSGIELIRISASYIRINPCSTSGNRIVV
jgi:hypothetical protein